MWVRLEIINSDSGIIYLPLSLAKKVDSIVNVCFGKKEALAGVYSYESKILSGDISFHNPENIKISRSLLEKLLIVESIIYRIKIEKNNLIIGPVIAMLLGNRNHLYSPAYMKKYTDRFGIYDKLGGLIYAFSCKSIDWGSGTVYGLYYDNMNLSWKYGRFPLPMAIYRRNFHISGRLIRKLNEATEGNLFNSTRFTKEQFYKYVEEDKYLSNYLIPTEIVVNIKGIERFLKIHKRIILKPTDLSRGRGICIIEKTNPGYKVLDYRLKDNTNIQLENDNELEKFLDENQSFFDKYIAQKCIELARVEGSCFDIRVVVQKNDKKDWKCTGIECRVANRGILITNISRGGYALPISVALLKAFPSYPNHKFLMWRLGDLCKKLCHHMDKMGEHFGELGLDVAFDVNKDLWLIEANVFPSFKGFKKMNYNNYLNIRYSPLIYAVSLAGFSYDEAGNKVKE